jgi:hypothetical protein
MEFTGMLKNDSLTIGKQNEETCFVAALLKNDIISNGLIISSWVCEIE